MGSESGGGSRAGMGGVVEGAGPAIAGTGQPADAGTREPVGAGGVLQDRAEEAWELRRTDPGLALRLAEAVRDQAIAAADDTVHGCALVVAGSCHLRMNDHPAALRALRESLWRLRDGPSHAYARALSEAGDLDRRLGHYAEATELLFEARKRYREAGDDRGEAEALARLGVAFFHRDALEEAEEAYERSLALHTRLGDVVAAAGLRNNLAKVATARGLHDQALAHLSDACRAFEAADERRGLGMALHNTAVVLEQCGHRAGAELYLGAAITLYDDAGHPHGACEARTRLGRLLADAGQGDRALALFRRAYDDAEALGLNEERARSAEALADTLEARGQVAEALAWLRRVRDIERVMLDEAAELRLRSLQVQFQLERLDRDSVTDALTGLLNRRGLDRFLDERLARLGAHDGDVGLLMLDLDNFKRVNDTYSHGAGDQVLRVVADLLRTGTRPTDVQARFGGEEFVVVLPGCDPAGAHRVAEELCARIREHDWTAVATGLEVTASVGVAALSGVADPRSFLAAADRALYAAKRAGKDQVCRV